MTAPTLPAEVELALETHAFSELRTEVGGLLVGTLDESGATITAALPALSAQAGQMHVTFTHEVWEHALTVLDRDHVGQRIVGWYHTHPGFGLFLSEYDRFVHREFFSDPRLLALVVDPLAGERGWFQDTGEELALVAQEATTRPGSGSRAQQDARPAARVPALLAVPALLLAGAIGGYAFGTGGQAPAPAAAAAVETAPAPPSAQETAAQAEVASLRRQVAAFQAAAAPTSAPAPAPAGVRYRIRRGDSLSELAGSLYGDLSRWPDIAAANPGIDADRLAVGQVVCLPIPSAPARAPLPATPAGGSTCP